MSLNKLVEKETFTYKETKDAKIIIYHYGKQVMILKDKKAGQLSKRLNNATEEEKQLALAKATGNFKHGNEKLVNKK